MIKKKSLIYYVILSELLFVTNNIFSIITVGYGVTFKNNTFKPISAWVQSEKGILKMKIIKPGEEGFLSSTQGPREIKWKVFEGEEIFLHYKTTKKYEHPHIITVSGQYGEKYQMTEKNSKKIEYKIEKAIWQTNVLIRNETKKSIKITIGSNSINIESKNNKGIPVASLLEVTSSEPLIPTWTINNETYIYMPRNCYDLIRSISVENDGKEFTIEARKDGESDIKSFHGNALCTKPEQTAKQANRNSIGSQPAI